MSVLSNANLILLPGIAANARTYEYLHPYFPNLYVPPWLPLRADETLAGYARRMVDSIALQRLTPPFFLGGHSFGGVLAQEMAAFIRPEALFLISSFRTHRDISRLMKVVEFMSRPAPHWLIRALSHPYRFLGPQMRRGQKEQLELLVSMFFATPLELTRWGARCSTSYAGRKLDLPIYHIHGSADPVLPVRYAKADVVLHRGTHIIPITRAAEVAEFIATRLARHGNAPPAA